MDEQTTGSKTVELALITINHSGVVRKKETNAKELFRLSVKIMRD